MFGDSQQWKNFHDIPDNVAFIEYVLPVTIVQNAFYLIRQIYQMHLYIGNLCYQIVLYYPTNPIISQTI